MLYYEIGAWLDTEIIEFDCVSRNDNLIMDFRSCWFIEECLSSIFFVSVQQHVYLLNDCEYLKNKWTKSLGGLGRVKFRKLVEMTFRIKQICFLICSQVRSSIFLFFLFFFFFLLFDRKLYEIDVVKPDRFFLLPTNYSYW